MIAGAILAGGGATRFGGRPKGLETIGGVRILDRVAAALRSSTQRLLLVSNDPAANEWLDGADVVRDVLDGQASAIGIHTALVRAGSGVVVIGWDMPFVPPTLVAELAARLRGDVSAVVPMTAAGPEAVCAAYATSAIPVFEELIGAGTIRLSDVIARLPRVVEIGPGELAGFGDPGTIFFNVNRPADRERAEAIARSL